MTDDDLTPDDLVRSLAGQDWWIVPASGTLPAIKVTDGPSGARGERFSGGPPSVCMPCGAALGATWDVALVARVGEALAIETRAKGAHVLLGPTVNMQRSPLGGRHFECFSEDPTLTAWLAMAYVAALQSGGVAACVKHLVANDIETDRFEISSEPDERTLREVSLLPFERALRDPAHGGSGGWSTMGAYNRLYGTHCCEHPELLTTILRDEWGWDGVVISDWFATHSTVPAAEAGLDIEMPGPPLWWGQKLADAVAAGDIDRSVVNAKRDRIGLLAQRTGAREHPPGADGAGGLPDVVSVAREAAAAAMVLLRNETTPSGGPILPLAPGTRIAVIGPNADREVIQGGGSARVTPTDVATVAGGLRERFDHVVVERGCSASRGTPALDGADLVRSDGTAGCDVEILDHSGTVIERLRPREFRAVFLDDPDSEATAGLVRATARFTARETGPHRFRIRTNGEAQLLVDTEPVGDGSGAIVDLELGRTVELALEIVPPAAGTRLGAELCCARPEPDDAFERAVSAAADAEVAIVVAGLDGDWETEGRDRDDLSLPGRQVELIRAVATAQPNTVVVVLAGSPVDLSWADDIPALLWAWYPGQEGGRALADVLLGAVDPGGRLPCTMPRRVEDTPAYFDTPPDPGVLRYHEGVFAGHRWYDARHIEPAFAFGHGLSYTTFAMGTPSVDGRSVTVTVTNTGARAGSETVQLYVGDATASVRRPLRELKAFAKVHLAPGESETVRFDLTERDLAFWSPQLHAWRAEVGEFSIWIGRSSRDLLDPLALHLDEEWTAPPSAPHP